MFRPGHWEFDRTAFHERSSRATRFLSLFVLLLTASGHSLIAAPDLPEFFGVYLAQGERLSRLEPRAKDASIQGSHELNGIRPVAVSDGNVEFLVYIGGATSLMEIPIVRLEPVAPKTLKNVWYVHPSEFAAHVAPVAERPGLLVRGKPSRKIPAGYWAIEVRENYFPFAVGKNALQAAGCLQRSSLGGYEPCRPNARPAAVTPAPAKNRALETASAVWGFSSGLGRNIWETAVVRSTAGLALLLLLYASYYWLRLILTRSYYLEVAPFRVWGDAAPKYMAEGLAACVVDEVQRLQKAIREYGKFRGSKHGGLEFHKTNVIPPATAQVTIEYKGISPEALNAFLRRSFGRHALITCDLVPKGPRLRLLGRSGSATPWEVETENGYEVLPHALREFAVRAVVAVRPSSGNALANALASKQGEAFARKDHDEAFRLAELGVVAMPDNAVQLFNRGVAHFGLERYDRAIADYTAAIGLDGTMASAFINRAVAYGALGRLDDAERDLEKVKDLDPKNPKVEQALARVREKKNEGKS
jgi:tetratricopeptide (TPR) repeat protein